MIRITGSEAGFCNSLTIVVGSLHSFFIIYNICATVPKLKELQNSAIGQNTNQNTVRTNIFQKNRLPYGHRVLCCRTSISEGLT